MKETNKKLMDNFTEIDQTIRKLLFLKDKSSGYISSIMENIKWDEVIDKAVDEFSKKTENFIYHLQSEEERLAKKIDGITPEDMQDASEKVKKKIDHLSKNFNKEIEDFVNGNDVQLKIDNIKSKAYLKNLEAEARFRASLNQMGESFRAWKDALELKKQKLIEDKE